MVTLGLRYPKIFEITQTVDTSSPTTNRFPVVSRGGTPYADSSTEGGWLFAAPGRYSAVRKVVFWVNARKSLAGTITARLRIGAICTTSANPIVPQPITIAPGSTTRLRGTGSVFPFSGFNAAHVFANVGPTPSAPLPAGNNMVDDPAITLTVEFDRFDASSADFFAYWDSQTDQDAYLFFRPTLENVAGNFADSTTGFQFANMGMSIVQAPSSGNRTCTIIPIFEFIPQATMPASYASGFRATLFDYISQNWNNITSVNMLTIANWANNQQRNFRVGLHRVNTFEPATNTLVVEEAWTDLVGTATGDVTMFRGADVKGLLVDGAMHHALYDNQVATTVSLPTTYLEIIQEDFTLTECWHDGGNAYRTNLDSGGLYGAPGCQVFDPTWFQGFTDEQILSRRIFLSFLHDNNVADTEIRLHLDTDFESDVVGLSGSSATMVGITPSLNSTPTGTDGCKTRIASFSPDPIDLAGQRRLVFGIVVPSTGVDDFGGKAALIYALSVPDREVPEVGDVFDLGAYNPEGCASTAAGLGDPGVLVITNGSTLPQKFNPQALSIDPAGLPEPFCDEPTPQVTVDDAGDSPDGGLNSGAIYRYRYTFRNCCTGKESNPNDVDAEADTAGASPAAEVTLSFAGVRIPADPQICEICVYRTIADGIYPNMFKVGCFDPDDTSIFVDDMSDAVLIEQDALSNLNAPPPCAPIVVEYRNRLFMMGDIPELSPAGTVSAEIGSDIITGSDAVEWTRCLEGKYIQLDGDCRGYEIACVMPPESGTSPALGRLKLIEPYDGETNRTGALYTICGRPNRLWFSEPFEAEYWPEINFIDVEVGDGDRLMGAVSNFDSLLICKRRKSYVLRFNENPLLEVVCPMRVSSDVGCVGPRTFAQVDSGSVWLADRGIAVFDGRGVQMLPESEKFDEFFTDPDSPNYVRRDINGRVIGAVGVYYPARKQYLLLLPTVETVRGANLLMVWDATLHNITVHKFCQEFLSMTVGKDSDGNQRVYLGDTNGFVWMLDIGDVDGVGSPGLTGTVEGTVTSAGIEDSTGASYIEDSDASFITGGLPGLAGLSGVVGLSAAFSGDDLGLAGVCVFYRAAGSSPDDPWVSRTIFAATPTRLYVTPGFTTDDPAPAVGYEYMIGAIDFRASFKPTNFGDDDMLKRGWRQAIVHEPEAVTSVIRVQLLPDFQNSDPFEEDYINDAGEQGDGLTFDMGFSKGRQVAPLKRKVLNFEQVVITQFKPNAPVRILNHVLMEDVMRSK